MPPAPVKNISRDAPRNRSTATSNIPGVYARARARIFSRRAGDRSLLSSLFIFA